MTVKMMKVAVAVSVAACLCSASAQQTMSINLGQHKSLGSQTDVDTVKVRGCGHGTSEKDALKDAYRDAIERAVGLYVDAEQAADNDELIRDQILTQSNAYIERYRVTSRRALDNGLCEVKIVAEVRKHELTAKMSSVMPPKVISLNDELKRLHEARVASQLEMKRQADEKEAKEMSQEKRDKDAAALIKNELGDFNPSALMLDIGIASQKPAVQESSGGLSVSMDLNLRLATEKYHKVLVPRLKQVLEQITLREPRKVSFILSRADAKNLGESVGRLFFHNPTRNITPLPLSADSAWSTQIEIEGTPCELPHCTIFTTEWPRRDQTEPSVWLVDRMFGSDGKLRVYMIGYALADPCISALYEISRKWHELPPVDFVAELVNASGDVITAQKFQVNQDCGWIGWGQGLKDSSREAFYILPWMSTVSSKKAKYRFTNGGYWDSNGNYLGTSSPKKNQIGSESIAHTESIPFRCSFKVLESELSSAASVRIRAAK